MIRAFFVRPARINGFPGLNAAPAGARRASTASRNLQPYVRQWFVTPRNAALPHRTGPGTVVGSVKVKGAPDTPVVRPVVVFGLASQLPLARTVSAPDGSYRFGNLPLTQVFVVSFDTSGVHRAVIADQLIPEVPAP
jgi:hypothetical protein